MAGQETKLPASSNAGQSGAIHNCIVAFHKKPKLHWQAVILMLPTGLWEFWGQARQSLVISKNEFIGHAIERKNRFTHGIEMGGREGGGDLTSAFVGSCIRIERRFGTMALLDQSRFFSAPGIQWTWNTSIRGQIMVRSAIRGY